MPTEKIAVTVDTKLLAQLDRLVKAKRFPSRSQAVQEALRDKIARVDRSRLARECAKLNPAEERRMAEEGLAEDFREWPAY